MGNPGLPMPNILGMIPGMTSMATGMMKGKIVKAKIPSIPEMIATAKDLGVKLHACSTTLEVMGTTKEMLIPEVDDIMGAATMIELSEGGRDRLHLGDSRCSAVQEHKIVDSRGTSCPGPITDLFKAYRKAEVGDIIELPRDGPRSKARRAGMGQEERERTPRRHRREGPHPSNRQDNQEERIDVRRGIT